MNVEDLNTTVTISATPLPEPVPILFHGDTLFLVEHNGEPYTPMKPIVEGMGLDWKGQYDKIADTPRLGMVIIPIPSPGGLQQTVCMPCRKLSGWLTGINPKKVNPAIREKVITYQNECDDALYDYWTKGVAVNPRFAKLMEDTKLPEVLTPEGLEVRLVPGFTLGNAIGLGVAWTIESSHVAYLFDRPHAPLLHRIRNLPISPDLHRLHFEEGIDYTARNGHERPQVCMSRDGFTMLTTNWRCRRDSGVKEAIYKAFDILEWQERRRAFQNLLQGESQWSWETRQLVSGGAL